MKTYSFDYLFDASLNDPYRKVFTLGDMERKTQEEDNAPLEQSFTHHLIRHEEREKNKSWFDKLLDKIYESQ